LSRYTLFDIESLRPYPLLQRQSKVNTRLLSKVITPHARLKDFFKSLPDILAVRSLKAVCRHVQEARRRNRPILLLLGAHVIKCGLSPVIIDLMKNGFVQGVAFNGAGAIHDFELACYGVTSEDVSKNLERGRFGMAREACEAINRIVQDGNDEGLGYGEAVGEYLWRDKIKFRQISLFAQAHALGIPATVHVAVGTDIVFQHKNVDGGSAGAASYRDFLIFAKLVSRLGNGGVVVNVGSAVILPEVFLKALAMVRNVNRKVNNFVTANFDMIQHYRPTMNIVNRPTQVSGKGYSITGHHEIMIPLLAAGVRLGIK